MSVSENTVQNKKISFWNTTLGFITQVTALIVAVTTLIVAIQNISFPKKLIKKDETSDIAPKIDSSRNDTAHFNTEKEKDIIKRSNQMSSVTNKPIRAKQGIVVHFVLRNNRIDPKIFKSIEIEFQGKSYSLGDRGILKLPKTKSKETSLFYYYNGKKESVVINEFEKEFTIQSDF